MPYTHASYSFSIFHKESSNEKTLNLIGGCPYSIQHTLFACGMSCTITDKIYGNLKL